MTKLKAVNLAARSTACVKANKTPVASFRPPTLKAWRLPRSVLDDRIGSLLEHSLTLLSAPHGYGKTQQLIYWHDRLVESGTTVAWFTLNCEFCDEAQLIRALVELLWPEGKERKNSQGSEEAESVGVTLNQLCEALYSSNKSTVFLLDQYESLGDSPGSELLAGFLQKLPPQVHTVLCSLTAPNWVTPKLHLDESLQLLTGDELRFSASEIHQFFTHEGPTPMTEEEIQQAAHTSDGWPAALKLISLELKRAKSIAKKNLALQGRSPLALDYVEQVIMADLSVELRAFLLQTAHLQNLRSDLCDHICQAQNSSDMLDQLAKHGLLQSTGIGGSSRAPPRLLKNFLSLKFKRLTAKEQRARHCTASDWYLEAEIPDAALYHALRAIDYDRAIVVYITFASELVVSGSTQLISELIKSLPPSALEKHPYLLWPYAWVLIISQKFEMAAEILPPLQKKLEDGVKDTTPIILNQLNPDPVHLKVMEYRIKQALDAEWAEPAIWLKLRNDKNSINEFLLEQIELSLGSAYLRRARYADAYTAFSEARRLADANQTPITMISATARMAEIRFLQGNLDKAIQLSNEAIDIANESSGMLSSLVGIPLLLRSRIFFARNELNLAENDHHQAVEMFRRYRARQYIVQAALHRARLINAYNGSEAALHALEESIAHLHDGMTESSLDQLRAEQVKYELLCGDIPQAEALLSRLNAPLNARGPSPTFYFRRAEQTKYLNFCRYLIQVGRGSTASAWLTKLLNQAKAEEKYTLSVEISTLLVLAHDSGDDAARTLRSVREMLILAERTGVIRPLIEEETTLFKLINKYRRTQSDRKMETDAITAPIVSEEFLSFVLDPERYATDSSSVHQSLSAMSKVSVASSDAKILTPRELEILQNISLGLSNKMIARELILGLGTVKWHVKNIFQKLDVSSRTQATSRARGLGLLD